MTIPLARIASDDPSLTMPIELDLHQDGAVTAVYDGEPDAYYPSLGDFAVAHQIHADRDVLAIRIELERLGCLGGPGLDADPDDAAGIVRIYDTQEASRYPASDALRALKGVVKDQEWYEHTTPLASAWQALADVPEAP